MQAPPHGGRQRLPGSCGTGGDAEEWSPRPELIASPVFFVGSPVFCRWRDFGVLFKPSPQCFPGCLPVCWPQGGFVVRGSLAGLMCPCYYSGKKNTFLYFLNLTLGSVGALSAARFWAGLCVIPTVMCPGIAADGGMAHSLSLTSSACLTVASPPVGLWLFTAVMPPPWHWALQSLITKRVFCP